MNVLLLRGLVRKWQHWGDFPRRLEKRLDAKSHCLDHPGIGDAHDEPLCTSISQMTQNLRMRWLEKGIKGPSLLIGHSLGGMVAMDWMSRYPNDFKVAAIMSSSASDLAPLKKRLQLKSIPLFLKIIAEKDDLKREKKILKLISETKKHDDDLAQVWADINKKNPLTKKMASVQLLAASQFKSPNELNNVFFCVGTADKMVSPECSERLAQKYNAPLFKIPGAGHDLALDSSEALLEKISEQCSKVFR